MSISKFENELIKRIQTIGKGTLIDADVSSLKFTVTVSAIQNIGVESKLIWLIGQLATLFAWEYEFECNLKSLIIFPIILDSSKGFQRKNFINQKKKYNSYFVGTNVDFDSWSKANKNKKIELSLTCLIESINKIPDDKLDDLAKANIVNLIHIAANEIQSNF